MQQLAKETLALYDYIILELNIVVKVIPIATNS